jgi:xanthine dehydrogenase YagR molybdenum-binding subunit
MTPGDVGTGIGAPVARPDGPAKVSGRAAYAGDDAPAGTLHGVLVTSSIAAGTVTAVDAAQALRVRGVLSVLTHESLPQVASAPVPPAAQSFTPMQDTRVLYEGQPIAIVLAGTLEAAEEGASKVQVTYRKEAPQVFSSAPTVEPRGAQANNGYAFAEIDTHVGGTDDAWSRAHVVVDQVYATPARHHNPIEPSATVAEWRGDEVFIHDATQWTYGIRYTLSAMLGIAPDKVHVRCPYTGGGFGCKGYVWPHQVLAVLAARVVERPVRIRLTRQAMYTGAGYQPAMSSHVRLAAAADGRLTAMQHDTVNMTSMFDDYIEFGSAATRALYATPALVTSTRIRHCHVGTPTAMRAPHEGPGLFALESAMDELAHALKMDPLALRLANHADRDPSDGRPFSSKKLREVYVEAARRFGWDRRAASPRAVREGDLLIGWGMASCIMTTFRFAANARVAMRADGTVRISAGTQEIGTGPYTVMPQIASEMLGVPVSRVSLALGDTSLPETGGTFGSSTTLSVGSAVKDACEKLKARLLSISPRVIDLTQALAGTGIEEVSAEGSWKPHGGVAFDGAGGSSGRSMHTWGAIFVEVAVDEALGLVRMRRAVGGYSAGRIVNPRTARSQMIGGIVWGYGQALLEQSAFDERHGRYLSKNLSGVMLPVNADIPADIDVFFADEFDPHASAIGARGIGELGATGVAAAIANAVWHATGRRIRRLPIHMADVLE